MKGRYGSIIRGRAGDAACRGAVACRARVTVW